MEKRLLIPDGCAWVNYVRSHDDIGWTFSDEDAEDLWINGYDHRKFLNEFYRGKFSGSFARGLPFQENRTTGDIRISGTCASLAGLEKAISEETELEVHVAIKRILLIYGIIVTIGGIPVIYLGDEIGTQNDYSYQKDKIKAQDSRWVHRQKFDDQKAKNRKNETTIEYKIFTGLQKLIELRKSNSVFHDLNTKIIDTGNPHIFGYIRQNRSEKVVVLANFSEKIQEVILDKVVGDDYNFLRDLVEGEIAEPNRLILQPYDLRFFQYFIDE